jgi:hypothetical protein
VRRLYRSVIPNFLKKEEKLKIILFFFVFSSRSCATGVWNFWEAFTSKIVEFFVRFMRWGRELSCERVGLWNSIRHTSPPNPSRPPSNARPRGLAATIPQTLAAPPSPPLLGAALPLDLRRVGANLQLEFGGRKEGGKGEKSRCFFINSCLFVLQFSRLDVYVCELVEVLSRNFVGGRTAVVLAVSRFFVGN